MATKNQVVFIRELSLKKVKDFKEFREMFIAADISKSKTALESKDLTEMMYNLSDKEASRVIDALKAKPDISFEETYSTKRINQVDKLLTEVLTEIEELDFEQ